MIKNVTAYLDKTAERSTKKDSFSYNDEKVIPIFQ